MMPATIARAASAGEAFSAVSASPILVSIGPGYTPNTCVFCPRSIARATCVSEWVVEGLPRLPVAAYGDRTDRCGAPGARHCSRPARMVLGAFPRMDDGGGREG